MDSGEINDDLWFYPQKITHNYRYNTLNSLKTNDFEEVLSNENFPDPLLYFFGFFSQTQLSKEFSDRLNNLKFINSMRYKKRTNQKFTNLQSNTKRSRNNSFNNSKDSCMDNTLNEKNIKTDKKNEAYFSIKNVNELFKENAKTLNEIHKSIVEKRHNSIRRGFQNNEKSPKENNFFLKESYRNNKIDINILLNKLIEHNLLRKSDKNNVFKLKMRYK